MDKMQNTINRWEGGIKATEGAIVPQKSQVYPISFKFDETGLWSYKNIEKIDYNFTVKDLNKEITQLDQLNPNIGKETLGVFLAPDRNNDEAVKQLRKKTEKWAKLITNGYLNPTEAWLALETTIIKSIEYPLPALTLSQSECKKIMAPALQAGLNASHISRTFPRDVVYGDKKEGGLGIPDIYHLQGISHITLLQKHIKQDSLTGDLFRQSIEAATIELGFSKCYFSLPYESHSKYLTDCWMKHLWLFINKNKITIQNYATPSLQPSRENDLFIMDVIIERGDYKPTKLNRINACHLFLQATTLSNILEGNGTKLTQCYYCKKDKEQSSPFV